MKKTIFYLALAAVAAVSCVKEQNPGAQAPEKTLAPMEFLACAEMTKTALADDGMSVEWIEGDQVAIFDGSNMNGDADEGQRFKAQSSGAAVLLAGEADPVAQEYYAIYPYSSGHSLNNGVFTTQIKAQQTVQAGSMAQNCAVVVGKAVAGSTKMEFKNVCSLVKFSLEKEGVKSLTLIGNNNEVIAGQFTLIWNNGDPKVTGNTKPEVTVTLRDAEGADLAIGDYYFTILPTEFTKGFSVILGKNDGTQEIISRGAVPALSRNQIFRTQNNIPAAAYKAHESNFVKYNDGFPLTYSHLTVQKGAEDAYAKYVNDGTNVSTTNGDVSMSSDGVYFVGTESTAVGSSVLGCSKLIIAGDNPAARSKITMLKALQPKTAEDGMILCADLDITSALRDFMSQGQSFTSFGNIVFNNCKINTLTRHFAEFGTAAMTLDYFVMEDCDVLLANTSEANTYILTTNKMVSTINNLEYRNNVFHQTAQTSVMEQFRLANCVNGTGSTLGNVVVSNNTLVKAYLSKSNNTAFIYASAVTGVCDIQNNFFVESHPASGNTVYLIRAAAWNSVVPTIKNNFFYVKDATKKLELFHGTVTDKSSTSECRTFDMYPLSANWDPANDVFGYADNLTYRKLGAAETEGKVAAYRGAQRTTTPAAQNRAGYGYSSEVLGNL